MTETDWTIVLESGLPCRVTPEALAVERATYAHTFRDDVADRHVVMHLAMRAELDVVEIRAPGERTTAAFLAEFTKTMDAASDALESQAPSSQKGSRGRSEELHGLRVVRDRDADRLASLRPSYASMTSERNHYRGRAEVLRERCDWLQSIAASAMRLGLAECRRLRGMIARETEMQETVRKARPFTSLGRLTEELDAAHKQKQEYRESAREAEKERAAWWQAQHGTSVRWRDLDLAAYQERVVVLAGERDAALARSLAAEAQLDDARRERDAALDTALAHGLTTGARADRAEAQRDALAAAVRGYLATHYRLRGYDAARDVARDALDDALAGCGR